MSGRVVVASAACLAVLAGVLAIAALRAPMWLHLQSHRKMASCRRLQATLAQFEARDSGDEAESHAHNVAYKKFGAHNLPIGALVCVRQYDTCSWGEFFYSLRHDFTNYTSGLSANLLPFHCFIVYDVQNPASAHTTPCC